MHFTITGSDMITKIFAKFLSTFMGIYHVGTYINIFFFSIQTHITISDMSKGRIS